jgi:hypothetical protein
VAAHVEVKQSPYLTWAKSRFGVRYNLARSGAPACDLGRLGPSLDELLAQDAHEDGWPPLLEAIAQRYGVTPAHVALAIALTSAPARPACSIVVLVGAAGCGLWRWVLPPSAAHLVRGGHFVVTRQ